ncbi:M20 family metallopeptidase [Halalkalibaculum sp. DA384]|uniref:M20 metallopeptidase family protein n=1 Tax=Halalkalibaculum sp. DA384 TaxID=3373606 RepID=UPI0037548515
MQVKKIQALTEQYFDEMVQVRRHLHRHPEVSYQEHETTKYIIEKLEELDIPADRPLDTGCVGVLEGDQSSDRVVALRADIDALAIQEEGEHKKEFMSENEGVAHCCGHDSHTANLVGAAHILNDLREEIEGTVLLIFQPAEEKLPGGGRLLCETGYLQEKGVDVIYGLHSSSFLEPGQIGIKEGPLMARPDEFNIEIIGKGGHAASPHETVDPVVLAAQAVTAIQTIASRNIDPSEPVVITIGKIAGGTAHNIIPEKVEMIGTIRTFSQQTAEFISERIEKIVQGITTSAGADYTYTFDPGYPAVDNTGWATDIVIETAAEIIGKEQVKILEKPIMAGEDFAFYQQHFPGAFFFLGSGSEAAGAVHPWHHPHYNVDEECFKTGAALMASLVFHPLPPEL